MLKSYSFNPHNKTVGYYVYIHTFHRKTDSEKLSALPRPGSQLEFECGAVFSGNFQCGILTWKELSLKVTGGAEAAFRRDETQEELSRPGEQRWPELEQRRQRLSQINPN